MQAERWIYQLGEMRAQTVTYLDAHGVERCSWTSDKEEGQGIDFTVAEYLEYLNARREAGTLEFVALTWDEIETQINAAQQAVYKVGQMSEIPQERFVEMLEVLPPMQWRRSKTAESFKMSELTSGTITDCFVRIGTRFFEGYGRVTTPSDILIDWAAMEYAKQHSAEYAALYC